MSKNFVLVHGAWHGGWCWNETKALLESQGHSVEAPDLPSHGDDSTDVNDVSLADCVNRVVASVENLEGKVVLVATSTTLPSRFSTLATTLLTQSAKLTSFTSVESSP